jgi:ABC-type glycerol-3-phosphate transport system substrate-binding protein
MKKFVLALAVFLAAAVVFAGGGQETMAATGKTDIVFLTNAYAHYTEALPKYLATFEAAHPDVHVLPESYPYSKLLELIELKLSAQTEEPDVLFVDVPLTSAYTAKGYIEPLDKYFSAAEKKDWVPAALAASMVGGKLMSAPLNNSSQIIFYNTKHFKDKGLQMLPKDPEDRLTWAETLELAQKLTVDADRDGTNEVFGFCMQQVNRPYQLLAMPQSLGGKAISDDGLSVAGIIDSPAWIEAFGFYQNLFNKWNVSPKGIGSGETSNYFTSGKITMFLGTDFNVGGINATEGLEWDYSAHPYFAKGVPVTPTGSWHLGINKYSKKKDAAAKLVKYATGREGCIGWFKTDLHLNPNKVALDYIATADEYKEFPWTMYRLIIYETQHTAIGRPVTPGYLEYEQILTTAFEDIRNGADVEATLKGAVPRIDRLLEKYK